MGLHHNLPLLRLRRVSLMLKAPQLLQNSPFKRWFLKSKCRLPPPFDSPHLNWRLSLFQGSLHLFMHWNRRNTELTRRYLLGHPLESRKTLQNRWYPLTYPSGNWSKRLGSFCLSLTQQQKRTTSWVRPWDAIPFSYSRNSLMDHNPLSSLLRQINPDCRQSRIRQLNPVHLTLSRKASSQAFHHTRDTTGGSTGIFKHCKAWLQEWTPSFIQQKDLVKLGYMMQENINIANFLSGFGMASESCLNNLCLSREQRERLFEQFHATTNGPTREQIMLQLFTMTQQESAQMQFMLDISWSMSKGGGRRL